MAPDTTRKAVNLAAADARRAIEALQEQSISLQRELAEARGLLERLHDTVESCVVEIENGDANQLLSALAGDFWKLDKEIIGFLAPGPSDAKGEGAAKPDTMFGKLLAELAGALKRVLDIPADQECDGPDFIEAILELKSRASLTPLTDPTVRGVLVECSPDDDDSIWFEVRPDGIPDGVLKLRPASEFGVPAEPAQKLVPLPEGARVFVPADESGDFAVVDSGFPVSPIVGRFNEPKAPYGVPAERAWDQTELHKAQCESIGLRAEVERQSERIASLTSAAETAEAEAERLRKAIETHRHKNTGMACDHKQSDLELWSALTPPWRQT